MSPSLQIYLACWSTLCLIGLGLALLNGRSFVIARPGYWRLLAEPWRLASFAVAAALMVVISPHTGDWSWDYVDSSFMSLLTYLTAPWTVGVLYRRLRGRGGWIEAYVAFCTLFFSASGSYDLYILWRDGEYPVTWFSNIWASGVMYVCGGLFWSLLHVPGRGALFAFMQDGWPDLPPEGRPWRLFLYALPFALIVGLGVANFFIPGLLG